MTDEAIDQSYEDYQFDLVIAERDRLRATVARVEAALHARWQQYWGIGTEDTALIGIGEVYKAIEGPTT